MKDIKKMLTHPMLNPYDKNAMKSNLIVMQDYKPPIGQLFPNGALLAGPERAPNNVYVPAKQIQQNLVQGNQNDYAFSASTPDPRYIPSPQISNFLPLQSNTEVFQRQRQNEQYNNIQNAKIQTTQTSQTGNIIHNGHAARFTQNTNNNYGNNNGHPQAQIPRPTQVTNNFSQRQISSVNSQTNNQQNFQRAQVNRPRAQYTEPRKLPQTNNDATYSRIQNNENINNNQGKQPYTHSTPSTNLPQFSNNVNNPAGKELKQNLVSTIKDAPSTVITKTVSYSRVVHKPEISKPKSRITVKTWIVKPTKAARLIAEPTPYSYSRPSVPLLPSPTPTERLIDESTPYVYERPTTSAQTEKIILSELESDSESEEPYVYNKPTSPAEQLRTTEIETTRFFTTRPTRPTFSGRLNSPQTSPIPTKASRLYLTPSPFTSTARFYLPPPRNPTTLPRLYLSPTELKQPVYYQSAQLRSTPTIPSPTQVVFNENANQPSFTLTKHSRINANHNNLTFADILTKEKLDITVNDIVKDTDSILKTASPPQFDDYPKDLKSLDYSDNNDFAPRTTTDSGENLTSQVPMQTPTKSPKRARVIAPPAISLQPPNENFIYQNTNQLSNLPFFKESALPNTIERTVSIKITVPERIAAYLFKNRGEDFDKLEILNTGSSNYLVLSNNLLAKKNAFNFIPIAKLIGNKNSQNISDSQALVYSFLTDSLNVAREYNNIAQQEILSSTVAPTPAQQNLNNEDVSQITNKISQLTSSQYSSNSFTNNANIISSQKSNNNRPTDFTGNAKYTNEQNPARLMQTNQLTQSQTKAGQTQGEFYSSRFQIPNGQQNPVSSQNQLYSGQLYQWNVPDVTSQIYNSPNSANLVNPSNSQQTTQMFSVQRNTNQDNVVNSFKSSPQFEVIKANTIALNPAKLQLEPPEPEQFNGQESFKSLFNSGNGISAHLEDKIVGTIPHPLEDNKLLTYKKDQSYFVYTKLDDNTIEQNTQTNEQTNTNNNQNAKLINNSNNIVSYQLIPSVSYELEDEKEQQQILNAFQIDEFGAPRDVIKSKPDEKQNQGERIATSRIDYSVEHPSDDKQSEQYSINPLYSGPSSYTAPQSSVGSLPSRQVVQNNLISRLEDFSNNNNGYSKDRPARQFFFK